MQQWYNSNDIVRELRSARYEVIASLKARELTQTLLTYDITTRSLAARGNLVTALSNTEASVNFTPAWTTASRSLSVLLPTYPNVLYVSLQDITLNKTYINILTEESLDIFDEVGNPRWNKILDSANETAGYNSSFAPPIIANLIPVETTPNKILPSDVTSDGLFLGPVKIFDKTYADGTPLMAASFTLPVYNNTTVSLVDRKILGYITVVFNIENLRSIIKNIQGLGKTGKVLLLGPDNIANRWTNTTAGFVINSRVDRFKYVLPPDKNPDLTLKTGIVADYPIARYAWDESRAKGDKSGSNLDSINFIGEQNSVGYGLCPIYIFSANDFRLATVTFNAANSSFLLLVEQSRAEAFEPMHKLRMIVLATVFGVVFFILVLLPGVYSFSL